MQHANAETLKTILLHEFEELGINLEEKLVAICADGAAVNFGVRGGLVALLRDDEMPWLVGIHCLNHRLELAIKDSFKATYFDDVIEMMTSLYYLYEKSPI